MAKSTRTKTTPEAKARPVAELRDRAIKAAIWRNDGKNRVFHAVTFSRSYRDQDGTYRDGDSYTGPQLLQLADLARRVYHDVGARDRDAYLAAAGNGTAEALQDGGDEIPF